MRVTLLSACIFTLSLCVAIHAHPDNPDDVVVEIRGSEKDAEAVAAKYGFRNLRKVLRSRNFYLFSASPGLRVRSSQEQDAALRQLEADPLVNSAFRDRTVHLEKRDDWEKNYLDHTHEDLKDNYDESISDDFQSKTDSDPQPEESSNPNISHGTKCAGVIAAVANNSICGAGVSFCATIGGIRLLDGRITDVMEAETLVHKNQEVHIVSASWGPTDDGRTMGGQDTLVGEALKEGATLVSKTYINSL